jgi:two-component system, chemotaxis family, protein-glutamate methylesterase/glutaminase
MKKIRVLIIDDSATMRNIIRACLSQDPDIEICGEAEDPLVARDAIKALNPDVLTLDVEMPRMNGIEFLEKIMRLRPMPVIMVSTLTQQGADVTLSALEIGAFDCIGKPSHFAPVEAFAELPAKVKAAARGRVRTSADRQPIAAPASFRGNGKLIAIGSSTGGVEALVTVLSHFPANCPPTVITQHMPASFTTSFSARLNKICAPTVTEAADGAVLQTGHVYVAPGGDAHLEVTGAKTLRCRLIDTVPVNGHRPSVDVLFNSVAQCAGDNAVGLILTGMGRDGAAGLLQMRKKGARTIGQDESSCVVYGMPKAAHEIGAVERQLHLNRISGAVLNLCSADAREVA